MNGKLLSARWLRSGGWMLWVLESIWSPVGSRAYASFLVDPQAPVNRQAVTHVTRVCTRMCRGPRGNSGGRHGSTYQPPHGDARWSRCRDPRAHDRMRWRLQWREGCGDWNRASERPRGRPLRAVLDVRLTGLAGHVSQRRRRCAYGGERPR